jgi:uncharacterized membrane protein
MPIEMPTGAKLAAALSFAVVGWITTNYYVPNMPDVEIAGNVREGVALIGAIVGWRVMGPAVGKGYLEAAGSGIKTAVLVVFFALLLFSVYEMLMNSVKMRYDGAFDAITDVFTNMARRSQGLVSVGVLTSLMVGGIVAGILTEIAGRRWR